jgi:ribosome-associated protein
LSRLIAGVRDRTWEEINPRYALSDQVTYGIIGPAQGPNIETGDQALEPAELAHVVVDVIADKKGEDIVLLDIRPVSLIADYFVIGTGDSERQIKAILEGIDERLRKEEVHPLHVEGTPSSGWMVLDYGSVIVHVFGPEERAYYQLELLWKNATLVVRIK